MGYIAKNKPDEVVKSVLQTTENSFTTPKGINQSVGATSSAEAISVASEKVYFQIED